MYYLIYSSYAILPFHDADLQDLLVQSRKDNARSGITGLLYYFHGNFIQLIEGEEEQVKALYERIRADKRHEYPIVLKEGYSQERFFPDWTMGYKMPNADTLKKTPVPCRESGFIDKVALLRLFEVSI